VIGFCSSRLVPRAGWHAAGTHAANRHCCDGKEAADSAVALYRDRADPGRCHRQRNIRIAVGRVTPVAVGGSATVFVNGGQAAEWQVGRTLPGLRLVAQVVALRHERLAQDQTRRACGPGRDCEPSTQRQRRLETPSGSDDRCAVPYAAACAGRTDPRPAPGR
jgi:hypothetical protein